MNDIKLIIFDLDNTLVDLSAVHRKAFIEALSANYHLPVDEKYHDLHLEAMPTKEKLRKLGVPLTLWSRIIEAKQQATIREVNNLSVNPTLVHLVDTLICYNYDVYCASNSITETVKTVIEKLGLYFLMPFIGSDQVFSPKPSPEMYYKCMIERRVKIHETLIVEDSKIGEQAIDNSGAHKLMVKNAADLTQDKIFSRLQELQY